jgi:hypothetical protein
MTARLITNLGVVDLCVPYRCRHCGAHLGEFVAVDGAVSIDMGVGQPPRRSHAGWCQKCGKHYQFSSTHYTIEQVVAMRDNASL